MLMNDLTTPKCPNKECGSRYISITPSESKPDHAIGVCKVCLMTWAIYTGIQRCIYYIREVGGREIYCEANGTEIRYDPYNKKYYLCPKHADELDKLLESREAQLRNKGRTLLTGRCCVRYGFRPSPERG